MRKQNVGKGPERGGDKGVLCRRCTRQNLHQQAACTLANLTRGEVSSLLLHEPPQLGAAPPTHLIGWGSMHFDCYGPNKCGCVTKSMPNALREGGPPCAQGLRGRAPTEENPKRDRWSDGISNVRVHGMLHVLTKVWEALRRLIERGSKGRSH